MMSTPPTVNVAQADVMALLEGLKGLRHKISDARAAISPFEAGLEMAYMEYQDRIGPLQREASRLQAQINELRGRIEGITPVQPALSLSESDSGKLGGSLGADAGQPFGSAPSPFDTDAVAKDKLLEHAYRVLDPMTDPADAELVGQLQGLISNPKAKLGDLLEGLDWGPVWEKRSRQETLTDQYLRLTSWERALTVQLTVLKRGAALLRQDRRYGLWQQRQKGAGYWRSFLDKAARQFGDEITDLQAEHEMLSQQWAQMVIDL